MLKKYFIIALCLFGFFTESAFVMAQGTLEGLDLTKRVSPIESDQEGGLTGIERLLERARGRAGGITYQRPSHFPESSGSPINIVYQIIDIIFLLAGIIAVIFIIIASIRMIANMGSDENVTMATKMLTNAVIGLLIIILSYAIVRVIINAVFLTESL